jgi:hypothetical protein
LDLQGYFSKKDLLEKITIFTSCQIFNWVYIGKKIHAVVVIALALFSITISLVSQHYGNTGCRVFKRGLQNFRNIFA